MFIIERQERYMDTRKLAEMHNIVLMPEMQHGMDGFLQVLLLESEVRYVSIH